jgi:hypothetical protein
MSNRTGLPEINMSAIPVAGVGGLGLMALVVIIAIALQPARWLLLTGIAGGTVIAILLVARRRERRVGEPRDDLPITLSLADTAQPVETAADEPQRRPSAHRGGAVLTPVELATR